MSEQEHALHLLLADICGSKHQGHLDKQATTHRLQVYPIVLVCNGKDGGELVLAKKLPSLPERFWDGPCAGAAARRAAAESGAGAPGDEESSDGTALGGTTAESEMCLAILGTPSDRMKHI